MIKSNKHLGNCIIDKHQRSNSKITFGGKASSREVEFDTFQLQNNQQINLSSNKDSLLFTQSRKQQRHQKDRMVNQFDSSSSYNFMIKSNNSSSVIIRQIPSNNQQNDSNPLQNPLSAYFVTPFSLQKPIKSQQILKLQRNQAINSKCFRCNEKQKAYKQQLMFLSKNNQQLFEQIKSLINQNDSCKAIIKRLEDKYSQVNATNENLMKEIVQHKQRQTKLQSKCANAELKLNELMDGYRYKEAIALKQKQLNLQENIQQYKIIKKMNEFINHQQQSHQKQLNKATSCFKQSNCIKNHQKKVSSLISNSNIIQSSASNHNFNQKTNRQFKRDIDTNHQTDGFSQWAKPKIKSFQQSKSTNLFSQNYNQKLSAKTANHDIRKHQSQSLKKDHDKNDRNNKEIKLGNFNQRAKTQYIECNRLRTERLMQIPLKQQFNAIYTKDLQKQLKLNVQRLSKDKRKRVEQAVKNSIVLSTSPTEMNQLILNKIGISKSIFTSKNINKSTSFGRGPSISQSIMKENRSMKKK